MVFIYLLTLIAWQRLWICYVLTSARPSFNIAWFFSTSPPYAWVTVPLQLYKCSHDFSIVCNIRVRSYKLTLSVANLQLAVHGEIRINCLIIHTFHLCVNWIELRYLSNILRNWRCEICSFCSISKQENTSISMTCICMADNIHKIWFLETKGA